MTMKNSAWRFFLNNLHRLRSKPNYLKVFWSKKKKLKGQHRLAKIDKKIYLINHVSTESFTIGRMIPPGTGIVGSFSFGHCVVCPSWDLLHLITSLVSSNFPKMILTHFIAMLCVVKCALHVSMISYWRLLHMINWYDKMIRKNTPLSVQFKILLKGYRQRHTIYTYHTYKYHIVGTVRNRIEKSQ